jgi:hypothetical protein
MNVEPVVQPKAAPLGFSGWGVTGRERPRMDGKRRTPVSPAVAAGEGAEPPSCERIVSSSVDRRVWLRVHQDAP